MGKNMQILVKGVAGVAVIVILCGILGSVLLFRTSRMQWYPTIIADAYREDQHRLSVPGSMYVTLTRTGAYGIYFEQSLVSDFIESRVSIPPPIECSLISQQSGKLIEAVPDYVETNSYWSKDQGGTGVLIMSMSVDTPGSYKFSCQYQDGSGGPDIVVALGPNYFWEFLKICMKVLLPVLGGFILLVGSICASGFTAIVLLILIIGKRKST
jgi:hypothetical protein